MGGRFSLFGPVIGPCLDRLFPSPLFPLAAKETRLVMIGLDSAGKTTLLYQFKQGKELRLTYVQPTVGFNVESVECEGCSFIVWDIGGGCKIRDYWIHYLRDAQGLVWVVDSSDRARVEEVRAELERLLGEEEMLGMPVLVVANKQDLPRAMDAAELTQTLGMESFGQRAWHVQAACAVTGEGVREGLGWMAKALENK